MNQRNSVPARPSSKISILIELETDVLVPLCAAGGFIASAWFADGQLPMAPIGLLNLLKALLMH